MSRACTLGGPESQSCLSLNWVITMVTYAAQQVSSSIVAGFLTVSLTSYSYSITAAQDDMMRLILHYTRLSEVKVPKSQTQSNSPYGFRMQMWD